MEKAKSDSSGAIAPPPLIALAVIALGVVLGLLWPVDLIAAPWQYIVGGLIIAASLLFVASAFRLFRRAHTPVPTYRTPTTLVTDGVSNLDKRLRLSVTFVQLLDGKNILVFFLQVFVCRPKS